MQNLWAWIRGNTSFFITNPFPPSQPLSQEEAALRRELDEKRALVTEARQAVAAWRARAAELVAAADAAAALPET